ncbi:MAG: hypothetical protein QOF51_550 [Chloroflexota bacterium]|nr:hypothetical protein [Chloroflexota bacterium]
MIQRSAVCARLGIAACTVLSVLACTFGVPAAALAEEVPPAPEPVAVAVDSATTALLIVDVNQQTCGGQPTCAQGVAPVVASLLASAREAGALVVYSSAGNSPILPEVAPLATETVVGNVVQNRFFDTNLDDVLRAHGITTIILVGWRANGAVLYTSYGANTLRYTTVVPIDGTSAGTPVDVAIGFYQMQNQAVANPRNQPLLAGAVTLSRSDLITFQ